MRRVLTWFNGTHAGSGYRRGLLDGVRLYSGFLLGAEIGSHGHMPFLLVDWF